MRGMTVERFRKCKHSLEVLRSDGDVPTGDDTVTDVVGRNFLVRSKGGNRGCLELIGFRIFEDAQYGYFCLKAT